VDRMTDQPDLNIGKEWSKNDLAANEPSAALCRQELSSKLVPILSGKKKPPARNVANTKRLVG
jgi:hypothetical protein